MVAKQNFAVFAFFSIVFSTLVGCTYVYEYRIEGRVLSLQDNMPVEGLDVSLKTKRETKTTKTTSKGQFSFVVEFVDPDFDSDRTGCTLLFATVDRKELSVDVSLEERPANQSVKCVVFIGLPGEIKEGQEKHVMKKSNGVKPEWR